MIKPCELNISDFGIIDLNIKVTVMLDVNFFWAQSHETVIRILLN